MVIFYTTHCPRCHILDTKLKQKGIEYTECEDVDKMISKGLDSAPALEVNGELMDFKAAIDWVKEQ